MKFRGLATVMACIASLSGTAFAQAPSAPPAPPPAYGPPITLAQAKKVAAAAEAEARRLGLNQVIVIVEPAGDLVYLERMDGISYGTIHLAERKAQTAARFRRPSQIFEERVQAGSNYLLGLEGALPVGGGVPIVSNGEIIGAIGVAGAPLSPPDSQVAKVGADAIQ
jgi:glc operon protein GlcG